MLIIKTQKQKTNSNKIMYILYIINFNKKLGSWKMSMKIQYFYDIKNIFKFFEEKIESNRIKL